MGNLGGPGSIHAVLGLATAEVKTWRPASMHVIRCGQGFVAILLHVALVCFAASVSAKAACCIGVLPYARAIPVD